MEESLAEVQKQNELEIKSHGDSLSHFTVEMNKAILSIQNWLIAFEAMVEIGGVGGSTGGQTWADIVEKMIDSKIDSKISGASAEVISLQQQTQGIQINNEEISKRKTSLPWSQGTN
jgi:hypothetical protein